MPWRSKEDKYGIPGDISGTRGTLLQVATKFNIYFLLIMAVAGAALFIAGLVGLATGKEAEAMLKDVPEPVMLMMVGMISFSLFFPFFMALYFGRHFLRSVVHLEDEIARLKATIQSQPTPNGPLAGNESE